MSNVHSFSFLLLVMKMHSPDDPRRIVVAIRSNGSVAILSRHFAKWLTFGQTHQSAGLVPSPQKRPFWPLESTLCLVILPPRKPLFAPKIRTTGNVQKGPSVTTGRSPGRADLRFPGPSPGQICLRRGTFWPKRGITKALLRGRGTPKMPYFRPRGKNTVFLGPPKVYKHRGGGCHTRVGGAPVRVVRRIL